MTGTNDKIPSTINQIKSWFEKAIPQPTDRNIHTQIGVHLEEVAEMVKAFEPAGKSNRVQERIAFTHDVLNHIQEQIKLYREDSQIDVKNVNREELLDALCDQIVTAIGMAHMFGLDITGGLKEVADSNDSKFDEDGNPIFNDHMKIMKGPNYFAPNLRQFT